MPLLLDGLTDAQHAAVTHPGGPLLVLGGAGTGKTHVLAHRLAWLAERGAPAETLLALTHDERMAAALRASIEGLVEPPYEELRVHTLRGFCLRLLRDEALEAGLEPGFSPVTRADRVALLLDRLGELSLRHHEIRGNPAPLLASFIERIDRLKDEMISAEDCLRWAEGLAADDASDAERSRAAREIEFAGLYRDHDRLLGKSGTLDAGDVVLRAFALLHERPHVRERTARRFAHVLVDEYQELDFAGGMVLGLLCEERRAVTAAGDDDQGVHRFGGAAALNLREFEREYTDATVVTLEESRRCPGDVVAAATAVAAPATGRIGKALRGRPGGGIRFWHCASERAQAQAVAAEAERLVAGGASPDSIGVLVRRTAEAAAVCSSLEERALPFRESGSESYFQRAEVRDVLAWLRLLADPTDAGAAVRALSRAPVELHSVDIARLTQLARRRKLDMPAAAAAALEGPSLSPEGRERAQAFLRLYRAAAAAFEDRRPDAFVLRLIERIGIRRQQVFATQAGTVARLRNVARLPELATAYLRREPDATPRDFTRYLKAVADSGLREPEAPGPQAGPAVRVLSFEEAKGSEFDHVFVLGLTAARMPGRDPGPEAEGVPAELLKERLEPAPHEDSMRRLLHVAMTRARRSLCLSWADESNGSPARPSPFFEEARAALGRDAERFEEELFGPAEGLHSSFRIMRDELLDTVARVGGRLGELRLDTGADVTEAIARYLELLKVAALIERSKSGQSVDEALAEVNALIAQGASSEQRELLEASELDEWLREPGRDPSRRPSGGDGAAPSLDPFIPRRRGASDGLMLSASDIETYRICPLKYKFARVFRIPQEPTINQRFGIALHQVLERFHQMDGARREDLFDLFETAWRRAGFGDSDDELQFRERALASLEDYWERSREDDGEPVWFERSFSFDLGPHLVRGRVDRIDRLPDGSYELIDYKTGKSKTEEDLQRDVQLSIYQMGARDSWGIETSAQSYWYVMSGRKVPVAHSEEELERVRSTVEEIGAGILRQDFQPTPSQEICSFCDYRIICPAAER